MKTLLIGLGVVFALLVAGILYQMFLVTPPVSPSTTTGVRPGSTDMTYVNASSDVIQVSLPFPHAIVSPDFTVRGKARGPWFFEASFPVVLLDKTGKELATGIAQANGDWMTNEFVPFAADITIATAYQGEATLILKKDNPSGIEEKDASVSFPIVIQ